MSYRKASSTLHSDAVNGSTTVVGELPRALTLGHPAPDPRWISRSTYYAEAAAKVADAETVEEMKAICGDFEAYGYRRVDAERRHRGYVVSSKKFCHLKR